jgi:glucose-1-phosphate adenylyltransferase
MRNAMALVLSGGGGSPLSVLTAERAVSAAPFGGKYRVIDFVLSNCCHSEVHQVGILTQYAPTSLHDHIGAGRPWDLDRRGGGVLILQPYVTRNQANWYRGTADAIVQNWPAVVDHGARRLLVLSGDHVYRMDYRALLAAHERRGAAATLAVTRVPAEEAYRFGMVTMDDDRVVRLEEKPRSADTPWASMGVYVFETSAFAEHLARRPTNLVLDVVRPMLDAGERIFAHRFDGYWEDVGTIGTYYRANRELVAPTPRLALHDPLWPLLTRDEERPPVRIGEGARIEDSLIANGCRVSGTVRRSILFPGATVHEDAVVEDAIVMQDVIVEPGARVDRAILDKCARVGANAVVGIGDAPGDPTLAWLEGLALVGKDATIPPGAQIGRAAVVGIGSTAGDFAGGPLPAGASTASRPWYGELVP